MGRDRSEERRRSRKEPRDGGREPRDGRKERKSGKKHRSRKEHRSGRREDERLPAGARPISEADYFLRATEFRVWLARSKSKYVEELSTDESTALFVDKFARKWNRGKLPREYYEGLPESMVEQTRRTRHTWGFVSKLGERERFDLATAKDSVGVATRKTDLLAGAAVPVARPKRDEGGRSPPRHRHGRDDDSEEDDREGKRRAAKRHRRERESDMEELVPKETGREAMLEKRRQTANKLHGAARDREDGRDGLDVSDDFLMGGRGDDKELSRRLAQRDSARRQRDSERQERLAGFQAKESARMDKFLQDMGLADAGKARITIAPRPPPRS